MTVGIVVAGAFLGVTNTLVTEAVMGVGPGRAPGRVGGVLVRPVHRRRGRPVRRAQARREGSTCTRRSGSAPAAVAVGVVVVATGARTIDAALSAPRSTHGVTEAESELVGDLA